MGNIHVFYHRIPALSTAVMSSIALGFTLSAGLRCDFILVASKPGEFIEYSTEDGLLVGLYESNLGIACSQTVFSREGDFLWNLSWVFWVISSISGSLAGILSWLLTTVIGPTERSWKALSILSAISAVFQVPIFLMFEVKPCISHLCFISTSGIMLIISCIFWVTSTIITQCQDPPLWAEELNAWRVHKELQEGQSSSRSNESKILRWLKRRKWAHDGIANADSLHLKATESESVNGGDDCLALMENGSYYANSNNSRLMLKVMPDGKRPGDDRKSETSFGDIEDMVDIEAAEEARYPEDEESTNSVLPEGSPDEKKELMIIRSHEDTDPSPTRKVFGSPTKQGQTEDNILAERESPGRRGKSEKTVVISGLRALAGRVIRESRLKKNYYCTLDDEPSDADDENDGEERERTYSPPMTPCDIDKLDHNETPSPVSLDGSSDRLMQDWNTLHASTRAVVPKNISFSDNSIEDEPEPVFYSSDDSRSSISLSSFMDKSFEEHQDDVSGLSSSTLSDSSADEERSRNNRNTRSSQNGRSKRRGRRRRKKKYPGSSSVASRTSLLELTIEEETDIDLRESSDEENLTMNYPLRTIKSAPDCLSLLTPVPPHKLTRAETFPPYSGISNVSGETLHRNSIDVLLKNYSKIPIKSVGEADDGLCNEDDQSPIKSATVTDETILGGNEKKSDSLPKEEEKCQRSGSETEESTTSSDSDSPGGTVRDTEIKKLRRSRSLSNLRCNKRRSVHPISPLRRVMSVAPQFLNDESTTKADILSSSVNIVSDASSENSSSADGRSIKTTLSRQARRARIKRLREERRRAKTVDPKHKRVHQKQREQHIILDPTVRAVMVKRTEGMEYGPDEASL